MSFHCDSCGANRIVPMLRAPDFRIGIARRWNVVACASCGLAALHPQPSPEELMAHYPDWLWKNEGATRAAIQKWRLNLAALARWHSPGDLLDVGCATGEFLVAAARKGWRAHGLEISAAQVEVANAQIADLPLENKGAARAETCADFLAWRSDERFDAVSFNHVLEHVPSPRTYLQKASRVLKPGGVLMISVPNWDSLSRRAFGPFWMHLDLPRHLFHFSPRSLHRLLFALDFEILETRMNDREQDSAGLRQSAKRALKYGVLSRPVEGPFAVMPGESRSITRNLVDAASRVAATTTEILGVADTFRVVARRKR